MVQDLSINGSNQIVIYMYIFLYSVYSRKLDYLEAAINRGNQISGDCNVCVIVKLESKTGVDVKDGVDTRYNSRARGYFE